jgi:alpha-galactosidase
MSVSKKPKAIGHTAHTHDAAAAGLPGKLLRPIKITMLGAGSAFTPRLMNDVLRIPGDQGGTIALVDIDRERLATMTKLVTRLAEQLGKTTMTDFRSIWRGDFTAEGLQRESGRLFFLLKAHKPARA